MGKINRTGMTIDEISRHLHCSKQNVSATLARAKKKLKKALFEAGYGYSDFFGVNMRKRSG